MEKFYRKVENVNLPAKKAFYKTCQHISMYMQVVLFFFKIDQLGL